MSRGTSGRKRVPGVLRDLWEDDTTSVWPKLFWTALAIGLVLPVYVLVTEDLTSDTVGALLFLWALAGLILWIALRLRARSKRKGHRASVAHVVQAGRDSCYFAQCDCGWTEVDLESAAAAFAAARKHTANVDEHVDEVSPAS